MSEERYFQVNSVIKNNDGEKQKDGLYISSNKEISILKGSSSIKFANVMLKCMGKT